MKSQKKIQQCGSNQTDPPRAMKKDILSTNGPLSDVLRLVRHGIPPLTILQELLSTEIPPALPAKIPSPFHSPRYPTPTSCSQPEMKRNGSLLQSILSLETLTTIMNLVPSSCRLKAALNTKPDGTTDKSIGKTHGSPFLITA